MRIYGKGTEAEKARAREVGRAQGPGSTVSAAAAVVGASLLAVTACCGPLLVGLMVQALVTLGGVGLIRVVNQFEVPVATVVGALSAFTAWRARNLLVKAAYTALGAFALISVVLRLLWDFGVAEPFRWEPILLIFANRQSALTILALVAVVALAVWLARARLLRRVCEVETAPLTMAKGRSDGCCASGGAHRGES